MNLQKESWTDQEKVKDYLRQNGYLVCDIKLRNEDGNLEEGLFLYFREANREGIMMSSAWDGGSLSDAFVAAWKATEGGQMHRKDIHLPFDPVNILSFEWVKKRLRVGLRKARTGGAMSPFSKESPLEGLEYYLMIVYEDQMIISDLAQLLRYLHISVKDAWTIAEENTKQASRLWKLVEIATFPMLPPHVPLSILSTEERFYGAGALVNNDALAAFGEHGVSQVLIFPSSVHELLVLPYAGQISQEKADWIVKKVNKEKVPCDIQLADRAYILDLREEITRRVMVVKYGYATVSGTSEQEILMKTDQMCDCEFDWSERNWKDAEIVEDDEEE